ncbi:MAG TPA: glycosyltransferase family A protein [Flavobacteriaceae bacterium]
MSIEKAVVVTKGLSIITPHYNDFDGLKHIYGCLKQQSSYSWEWLVIDDLSDAATRDLVEVFFQAVPDNQVQLILNATKTNAAVCRNIGIDHASHDHLVFLDSDDSISVDFVANRQMEIEEFVVFRNYNIVNEKGEHFSSNTFASDPLDCFLSANFIWQTTCVLWKKAFLIQIGKFDINLQRLQDVELTIRALFEGKNYKIIDNKADFFYYTKPIRLRTHIVSIGCASINYLILKMHSHYTLDAHRHSLIKAYYYLCVKNLHRSNVRKDVVYVKESLKLFHNKKYVSTVEYFVGIILLILFKYHLISDILFLKFNRYIFK